MKKSTCFILLPMVFLLSGCLNYAAMEIRMFFSGDGGNEGKIEVVYRDISTDSESEYSRESDFNSLVDMLHSDELLLDYMQEGMYVAERELFVENGVLNARISGLFRNFKIEDNAFQTGEKFRELQWKDDDLILDETNGMVSKTDSVTLIRWPVDEPEVSLSFKQNAPSQNSYSLLKFYKRWQRSK